jgi:integrase
MSKQIVTQYLEAKANALPGQRISSPKVSINQPLLDWLPTRDFEYYVRHEGLTGLRICVHPTGTKVAEVAKKVAGRSTILKVCDIEAKTPFDRGDNSVLKLAGEVIANANKGVTVAEKKSKIKKKKAKKAGNKTTFLEAANFLLEAKGDIAASTRGNYERFRDEHMKSFHGKRIADITEDDARRLHQKLTRDRGPFAANSGLKFFNTVWRGNMKRLGLGLSPGLIFTKTDTDPARWNKEDERRRHVEPGQLKLFLDTLDRMPAEYPGDGKLARDYILFCLYTGLRRREVTNIVAKDIDKQRGVIWIGKNKSKRAGYNIPLTPAVKKILDRRPKKKPFNFDEPDKMFAWITKQTQGKTSTLTNAGPVDGIKVSSHDLRRSWITYAKNAEVALSSAMAKSLVNHSLKGDVTDAHYDQSCEDPQERMKAALKVQEFILRTAGRKSAQVVNIKAARRA